LCGTCWEDGGGGSDETEDRFVYFQNIKAYFLNGVLEAPQATSLHGKSNVSTGLQSDHQRIAPMPCYSRPVASFPPLGVRKDF
jgi:hypothetical protein